MDRYRTIYIFYVYLYSVNLCIPVVIGIFSGAVARLRWICRRSLCQAQK
jgi:hypothetical protein